MGNNMSEIMKIPSIRFEEFTDNWKKFKLSHLYEFSKGKGLSLDSFYEGIDSLSIAYGHLYTKYSEVINKVLMSSNDENGVISQKGDLLFPGSSTVPFGTAQSNAIMLDNVKLGGDVIIARPKQFYTYAPFISYQINAKREKLFPITVGTTITHMYGKDISNIEYYFPGIDEQKRIGKIFENLDQLISLHQCKYEKLQQVKKSLLEKMFPKEGEVVPRIRFKGFTDGWEQYKFDEVVNRIATGLNPRDNFQLNTGGKNFYVTIKNFHHGNLRLDDDCDKVDDAALLLIQNRSDLKKNDILFSSIGRVGDCYLVDKSPEDWNINESVFTLRPNQQLVSPLYLFHTIHSDVVLSQILNSITGSTFKSIKVNDLKKAIVPTPLIDQQVKIGNFISSIENLITFHQRKYEKLQNIKKALLQKMFV